MSAPQIPNLLETLRASKASSSSTRGRSRGHGDGSGGAFSSSSTLGKGGSDNATSASTSTLSPSSATPETATATATPGQQQQQQNDRVVQQTDEDAAGSRLSAVEVGYLNDAFARMLYLSSAAATEAGTTTAAPASARAAPIATARRMPIINRGTYVRTTAIDALVDEFLSLSHSSSSTASQSLFDESNGQREEPTTARRQIISLGAGTDTRYFRLLRQHDATALQERLAYHELDFAATALKKIKVLQQHGLISILRLASPSNVVISPDGTGLMSPGYSIHGIDLRDLGSASSSSGVSPSSSASTEMPKPTALAGIDRHAPTLILSECCLTYLSPEASSHLLRHILETVLAPTTAASIVLYEPINPHDAFGRTMVSNLAARRIRMPGLLAFPSLAAHAARLKEVGFATGQQAWEVRRWWDERVSTEEKERLRYLEGLDEEEEWMLLAAHYALIRAWR